MEKKAAKIIEPYLARIEAGDPPTFAGLMASYTLALDKMPITDIEMACISSLLILLYPAEFKTALQIEWKRRGFTTDLF